MKFIYLICLSVLVSSCGVRKSLNDRPILSKIQVVDTARVQKAPSYFTVGNNFLRKNKHDIWELYVEGNPTERGWTIGSLTRELIKVQEDALFKKVNSLVPSKNYLHFLSKVVAWFNRKMYQHVPEEYKQVIYGISRYGDSTYNDFAKPYIRYHAAHDIGHALQDLMLVGCTSFAAWGGKTVDGQLLVGRNFDFFINEDFSKNKIVSFINPSKGYRFMSYSWAGMIGVVSGMNEYGLTVTINAAKTKIPLKAKTPISIVTRKILQYAKTIDEAIAIAQKMEVFVSESIMVTSGLERKAVLIEVSPHKTAVYAVPNTMTLVCANHFQSDEFSKNKRNVKTKKEGTTLFRYRRMQNLLEKSKQLTPTKAVAVLRDRRGVDGKKIGMGNELALNQLMAHHGIVFKPEERLVWVSVSPYQLGAFVAYDLGEIFSDTANIQRRIRVKGTLSKPNLIIPEDEFLYTQEYKNYKRFRKLGHLFQQAIETEKPISLHKINTFLKLNPYYWKTHALVGEYYYKNKQYDKALLAFKTALKRAGSTHPTKKWLRKMIKKCSRKM